MIEELYRKFLAAPQVSTDTRDLKKGSIFFALKGPSFNGNAFAAQAISQGCALAVIDEPSFKTDDRFIVVDDVLTALQELAAHHRKQLKIPVIAITGSNGKTTSKELTAAVLSKKYKVLSTKGNLNNHIGVPLTLLSITHEHEIAIVEMGANHQGEIAFLCSIAAPGYGIITNIGKAHLEGFGGFEGVKKGKSELYNYIREHNGTVFLHGDDPVLSELAAMNERITYGTKKLYDIVGSPVDSGNEFIAFRWATRYNAAAIKNSPVVHSRLVGIYNYYNLLCAACVGNFFKVEDSSINAALEEYTPSNNRSQLQRTGSNTLILDYYNANPSSMSLALDNFISMKGENKMVILGDMLELGEESKKEHEAILRQLEENNIEHALLVGPLFVEAASQKNIKAFSTSDEATGYLKKFPVKNFTILIKGSRGIRLEKVVEAL